MPTPVSATSITTDAPIVSGGADPDLPVSCMAGGIACQVAHRVLEQVTVARDRQVGRALENEFHLGPELEPTKHFFHQLAKHDLLATRNLLVRLGPSQHQQRCRQSVQAARLPLNMTDEPVTLLWIFASPGL